MQSVVRPAFEINFVDTPSLGQLAMSGCPGVAYSNDEMLYTIAHDVNIIHSHRIKIVLSLMETFELKRHGILDLSSHLAQKKIAWEQLQVSSSGTPSIAAILKWRRMLDNLLNTLEKGGNILIHCTEGRGRTAVMTACMLKSLGMSGESAIAHVRKSRVGAFQNSLQEQYVLAFRHQGRIG